KTNTFVDRLINTLKSTGSGFLTFLEVLLFLIIRLFPYVLIFGILFLLIFGKKLKNWKNERKRRKEEEAARRAFYQQAPQNMGNMENVNYENNLDNQIQQNQQNNQQ
ncbi:MAG: hypothetical protein K2N89_06285, partial [Lachnospiraceae bacterium]|nr:hypothetical protein [Lachnospiraceae bacterium]